MIDQLYGKWLFIGAEEFIGSQWSSSDNYAKGLTWTFHPQFFGVSKTIGSINEYDPEHNRSEQLNYAYIATQHKLIVEIFTDQLSGISDNSQSDVYEVITTDRGDEEQPIIMISILNEDSCPPPYFRYHLQKLDRGLTEL